MDLLTPPLAEQSVLWRARLALGDHRPWQSREKHGNCPRCHASMIIHTLNLAETRTLPPGINREYRGAYLL